MRIIITLNKDTTSTMISNVKDMTNTICDSMGICGDELNCANEWCDNAISKIDDNEVNFKAATPASDLRINSEGSSVVFKFDLSDKIILGTMKICTKIAQRISPMFTMAKGIYGMVKTLLGDVKADFKELYRDYEIPDDRCRYGYLHKDITMMESKYDVDIIVKNDGYNNPKISNMTINTGDRKISEFVFDNIKSNTKSVIIAAPQVFSLDAVKLLKQMVDVVSSEENLTIGFHSVEGHDRIYYIVGDDGNVYGAFRRTNDGVIIAENVDDINDYTHKVTYWASIDPNTVVEVASILADQARGVPFYADGDIEIDTADEYDKVFYGYDDDDDVEEEALEVTGNHDAGNIDNTFEDTNIDE